MLGHGGIVLGFVLHTLSLGKVAAQQFVIVLIASAFMRGLRVTIVGGQAEGIQSCLVRANSQPLSLVRALNICLKSLPSWRFSQRIALTVESAVLSATFITISCLVIRSVRTRQDSFLPSLLPMMESISQCPKVFRRVMYFGRCSMLRCSTFLLRMGFFSATFPLRFLGWPTGRVL